MLRLDDQLVEAKKYFKGQIIVDIGCCTDISLYRVSCISKAKAYIGIDYANNYDANLRANLLSEEYWKNHDQKSPPKEHKRDVVVGLAYEKAQDFLKRLPDNSVSVYAGGIDLCMVPSNEAAAELEKEIIRVLSPDGAYMANCSRLFHKFDYYSPEETLNRIIHYEGHPEFEVRRK